MPLFFLYDFDFVRKAGTEVCVKIDGKQRKLDKFPFPMPMNGQWRYYTRYTLDSQILEFLNGRSGLLETVEVDEHRCYTRGKVKYQYEEMKEEMALSLIEILDTEHTVKIQFEPSLTYEPHEGSFCIQPDQRMG